MKAYMDAVDIYEIEDVEAAVKSFLRGSVPGVSNSAFAPSAPMVGAEVRRQMNLRVESNMRRRALSPALPPPDVERTPNSRSRVGDMVAEAVANLKAVDEKADTEADKRRAEMWEKVNRRFRPDMSDEAIYQRLMVTSMGFEAGDDPEARDD